jgi:8-oxo-dGTP diphosphatase
MRRGSHGGGTWSFPGGHLEFGEDVEACAKREAEEETGATISIVRRGPFTNDIFSELSSHYVTLFVVAEHVSGNIEAREPEKCERWEWFDWKGLPQPLFLPVQNLVQTGFDPFS